MSLNKERAWDLLNRISFERISGTEKELEAAQILLAECEKAGVEAHIEEFEIDQPITITAKLEILEPEYCALDVIGISGSGTQDENVVEGGFKYIENANDINLIDVKDKIVLSQARLAGETMEKLVKNGAIGYITIGGNFYEEDSIKKELRPQTSFGKTAIPGLRIHMDNAEKMVRLKPSKVRLTLNQEREKKGVSRNVVATIEGSKYANEIIAFSAHYDSVPYSKGAWDNATGAVTIMELMHYFKENKPERTMKFVFCGSEEIGCVGSRKYCEAHEEELDKYILNINFDMTGCTIGYEEFVATCNQALVDSVTYLAKTVGYPINASLNTYSSDSTSFAAYGVPACTFARLAPTGGAVIHNHNDIMDRLDPDSFMITLEFVAKFAESVSSAAVNPIVRKFDDKINDLLNKQKEMMAKMGMVTGKKEEKKEEEKKEENK